MEGNKFDQTTGDDCSSVNIVKIDHKERKYSTGSIHNLDGDRRLSQTRLSSFGEPEEEIFVESKMHRKGSRVYKNTGWRKHSRTEYSRSDSTVSQFSSKSVSEMDQVEALKGKPETIIQLTADERNAFVEKKYEDIFDLLRSVGIDIKDIK